jgi:hypothetical protein
MYFIVSCLFNLGWILIELMVRQSHEQCGGGLSLSLNEKKNVLFFSFIEEIKFNTWELFNLPRCLSS